MKTNTNPVGFGLLCFTVFDRRVKNDLVIDQTSVKVNEHVSACVFQTYEKPS